MVLYKIRVVFNLPGSYGSAGTHDGACLVRLANWRIQPVQLYERGWNNPDNEVHGANTGPTWGRKDPGGPHVVHMNLAICIAAHHPEFFFDFFSALILSGWTLNFIFVDSRIWSDVITQNRHNTSGCLYNTAHHSTIWRTARKLRPNGIERTLIMNS